MCYISWQKPKLNYLQPFLCDSKSTFAISRRTPCTFKCHRRLPWSIVSKAVERSSRFSYVTLPTWDWTSKSLTTLSSFSTVARPICIIERTPYTDVLRINVYCVYNIIIEEVSLIMYSIMKLLTNTMQQLLKLILY